MSRKMILIPVERYNAMATQSKECASRPDTLNIPPNQPPDVKVKMVREKKMRQRQKPPAVNQQHQQQSSNSKRSTPDVSTFTGKKKPRARAFLKHIEKNKDRIQFNKGEFQFDGIKSTGSDMDDLTTALIDDKDPGRVPGWNDLMAALEGTQAPSSLYARWRKKHKKGDWGALSQQ